MKRTLALFALLACATSAGAVQPNPIAGFQQYATGSLLKPFALDLGGVLGAATVDSGRTYGFPGFWAGGDAVLQTRPDRNDLILRDSGVHSFALPMLQAGIGLPFGVDVILHGVGAYGATVYGGGVRKSLYRTSVVDTFLPNVSVSAFGDKVNAGPFGASHGAFNATAMWNLPLIKPFAEVGYDFTKVTVGTANTPGVAGLSATSNATRVSAGVDLTPLPLCDIRIALLSLHGIPGGQLGFGFTF
jgi:hypothetical protein